MHILSLFYQYYYLVLALQAFCVYHCIRKGNTQQWIWLIVFLPAIGCVIYLFTEVVTKNQVQSVTSNVESVIRPSGRIRDLEDAFRFSDSFENRLALANAYYNAGKVDEAIQLYEEGKQGIFANDPHLIMLLMEAYFAKERFADICSISTGLLNHPDFRKSHARIILALSLEQCGNPQSAAEHLASFQARYSDFEGKYHYGCFLIRQNKHDQALQILEEIKNESSRMTRAERRNHDYWIKQSLTKLNDLSKVQVLS